MGCEKSMEEICELCGVKVISLGNGYYSVEEDAIKKSQIITKLMNEHIGDYILKGISHEEMVSSMKEKVPKEYADIKLKNFTEP